MSAKTSLSVRAVAPLREFELDLELRVPSGERLAVVGPSGAGKSSLLRVIAGLLRPSAGRVELSDEVWLDTAASRDLPPELRRCGYVFQDYALFSRMSAWRNVAYGMGEVPRAQRRGRATELLGRFGIASLADARPAQLSGGERQRVALARALASGPRALLLDEPLSALDAATRRSSLRELHGVLGGLEIPIVLVTHSFDEAALLGDTIAVIDRGSVVQAGSAAGISARPRSAFVADFAGASVLRGVASAGQDGLATVRLDEGDWVVRSVDQAVGPVAVCVYPWEIALEPPGPPGRDSALNRVAGTIDSITAVGNRVRIGLHTPQVLSLEITGSSAAALGLRPGDRATAAWKATATRLVSLAAELSAPE
jgi:molybdate transport system ATP-binding protein